MDPIQSLQIFTSSLVGSAAPCVAAAVCSHHKTLFSVHEGNRQIKPSKKALTCDTLFDLASLTKILATTMLACRLYEKKELSFTDTIGKFFTKTGPYKNASILQLLTHSSGFVAGHRLWDYVESPNDALDAILSEKPAYPIGSRIIYSCFGFIVLGRILEKIGGTSLDILSKKEVFQPLYMHHSQFLPSKKNICAATELYKSYSSGIVHDENARFLNGISGNAGVFSTLDDCILFCQMLLNEGYATDGAQFLKKDTVALFNTEFIKDSTECRGLGFRIASNNSTFAGLKSDIRCYGHTGFTGTSLMINPSQGLAAILLTNRVHPVRSNTLLIHKRASFYDLAWELAKN